MGHDFANFVFYPCLSTLSFKGSLGWLKIEKKERIPPCTIKCNFQDTPKLMLTADLQKHEVWYTRLYSEWFFRTDLWSLVNYFYSK